MFDDHEHFCVGTAEHVVRNCARKATLVASVDVISEIVTYADYIAFSERLREASFTKDDALTCRWHNGTLTLDVLAGVRLEDPQWCLLHRECHHELLCESFRR